MTDQLKHCPFCGGCAEMRTVQSLGCGFAEIQCTKCNANKTASSIGSVVRQWNTRHIPEGFALVNVEHMREMFIKFHKLRYANNNEDYRVEHFVKKVLKAAQESK